MPALGADMEAGTLVEWLVRPGDAVKRGDVVAVVETQKGAIEIEIFQEGVVSELRVAEGEKAPVGAVLALLSGPKEPMPASAPPPLARAAAKPPVAKPTAALGMGLRASPAARRATQSLGVELAGLRGTGPQGAVSVRDVEAAASGRRPRAKPGLDLAEMRKAIANAMARSKREIPHYQLSRTIEVTRLLAWLEIYNAQRPPEERLLYLALLLKAVSKALADAPQLNGVFENGVFRASKEAHIGVAVALRGGGLVAPALHNVERLQLPELMVALRDLVQRARVGRLRGSELIDPTITVTNLGEDSADQVQPIIYPPQVAIVGFGSISLRPWVVDGCVEARSLVQATLGADHRVSDGRIGGQFLATLARIMQEPEKL